MTLSKVFLADTHHASRSKKDCILEENERSTTYNEVKTELSTCGQFYGNSNKNPQKLKPIQHLSARQCHSFLGANCGVVGVLQKVIIMCMVPNYKSHFDRGCILAEGLTAQKYLLNSSSQTSATLLAPLGTYTVGVTINTHIGKLEICATFRVDKGTKDISRKGKLYKSHMQS